MPEYKKENYMESLGVVRIEEYIDKHVVNSKIYDSYLSVSKII